jgi:hypothetical protein
VELSLARRRGGISTAAEEGGFGGGVGGEVLVALLEDARNMAICRDARAEMMGKRGGKEEGVFVVFFCNYT